LKVIDLFDTSLFKLYLVTWAFT